MSIHRSHSRLQHVAGPSRCLNVPSILAVISMPSPFPEGMATGRPASSAQADSASSGFSLRYPPDLEYQAGKITSVTSRGASIVPRPMPDFLVNTDRVQTIAIHGKGDRPVTKLPKTNLEKVEHPPGMTYIETYEWDLARWIKDGYQAFKTQ